MDDAQMVDVQIKDIYYYDGVVHNKSLTRLCTSLFTLKQKIMIAVTVKKFISGCGIVYFISAWGIIFHSLRQRGCRCVAA